MTRQDVLLVESRATGERAVEDRVEWFDGGCRYDADETEPMDLAIPAAVNTCLRRDGREVSVLEQRPLFDQVDPEALDAFLSSAVPPTAVSFTYEDHRVTVSGDRVVTVEHGPTSERP